MAERDEINRVEVGFAGGQSIVLRISEGAYDQLRRAVQEGRGWQEVETSDGMVALDTRQIVFVKRESSEHRIGFSGSA
jgi:phosphosulfolactate synthase (CoM biosynthesis protein A)